MSGALALQLLSSALCLAAMALNVWQASKWRRQRKKLKPACKVILHNGEQQLGIMGGLPPVGTILYRIDEPPPAAPREHTVTL